MTDLFQGGSDDHIDVDENKNYLDELVGEGKKFKTPQDLARGKYEADQYVDLLKRRLDEMREDYMKLDSDYKSGRKLEELIDQLENRQRQSNLDTPPEKDVPNTPAFDMTQFESLFDKKLQEVESRKSQAANFEKVQAKLKETFGNNYQSSLNEQTKAMGLTQEFVNDLARNHPEVLFRTLGLDQQSKDQFTAPPRSSRNSFAPKTPEKRGWAYYEQMRKENPKLYYDQKTMVQMHRDALDLGDDFADGDFLKE